MGLQPPTWHDLQWVRSALRKWLFQAKITSNHQWYLTIHKSAFGLWTVLDKSEYKAWIETHFYLRKLWQEGDLFDLKWGGNQFQMGPRLPQLTRPRFRVYSMCITWICFQTLLHSQVQKRKQTNMLHAAFLARAWQNTRVMVMVTLRIKEGLCLREDEGGEKEGEGERVKVGCGGWEVVALLSNINTDGNHFCLNKTTGQHCAQAAPQWSLARPTGCNWWCDWNIDRNATYVEAIAPKHWGGCQTFAGLSLS